RARCALDRGPAPNRARDTFDKAHQVAVIPALPGLVQRAGLIHPGRQVYLDQLLHQLPTRLTVAPTSVSVPPAVTEPRKSSTMSLARVSVGDVVVVALTWDSFCVAAPVRITNVVPSTVWPSETEKPASAVAPNLILNVQFCVAALIMNQISSISPSRHSVP